MMIFYRYEYNNKCYQQCPNDTYCNNNLNNYICYDYNETKEGIIDNDISTFKEDMFNGEMDDILENVTNGNNVYLIKVGDSTFLSLLTTEQKNNSNPNMSTIDLGECENDLKRIYNINKTLLMLKLDNFQNDSLIPIIVYEVYHPITKELLNLSLCINNSNIKISNPVTIDESSLFKYDPNDEFYKSNCVPYTTESGTDIIVKDRQKEFGEKNLSLCENNCEYMGYNSDDKQSYCYCKIKNEMETLTQINNNPNLLSNKFATNDSSSSSNLISMKCAKVLFTLNGLKIIFRVIYFL